MEQGAITGLVAEAGAYEWNSESPDSQSIFAGDGILSPLIKTSWERFKFGGRPGSQQNAYFVSLKELPNNRFGTQSENLLGRRLHERAGRPRSPVAPTR